MKNLTDKVRSEMQEALDKAWENNDSECKSYRDKLFPNGKPTLDDFLVMLVERARRKML